MGRVMKHNKDSLKSKIKVSVVEMKSRFFLLPIAKAETVGDNTPPCHIPLTQRTVEPC